MGRDKALLLWKGRPLIEHTLEKLRALTASPRILGARPDLETFAPIIPDNFTGRGPLAGIEAALSVTDTELNLFLPVDLPLLPVEFLRWMTDRAVLTQAAATVPRVEGRPQPLCAVYHRNLLDGIRDSLQRGDGKITRAIDQAASELRLPVDAVDVESIVALRRAEFTAGDSAPVWPYLWFQNLNTPADLERSLEARSGSLKDSSVIG